MQDFWHLPSNLHLRKITSAERKNKTHSFLRGTCAEWREPFVAAQGPEAGPKDAVYASVSCSVSWWCG